MALELEQLESEGVTVTVDRGIAFHEGEGMAVVRLPAGQAIALFRVDSGVVSIYELTFEAPDIDGQLLRRLSIPDLKAAVLDGLQERYPIKHIEPLPGIDWAEMREEWPNGDRLDTLLSLVTIVYNMAIDREQPPTQHVADRFQVSRATAGRMVAAARDAGKHLRAPAPYPGKRKGTRTDGEATT